MNIYPRRNLCTSGWYIKVYNWEKLKSFIGTEKQGKKYGSKSYFQKRVRSYDRNCVYRLWRKRHRGRMGRTHTRYGNLGKGGKASSINMATLQYEKWEKKGNMLILSGKSIGNHETISFTDTLTIEELTENKLTLKKGSLTINYQKQ